MRRAMRGQWVSFLLAAVVAAAASASAVAYDGDVMSGHVSGTFDVKMATEKLDGTAVAPSLGRMSIAKTFHGPLDATSVGAMLSSGNPASGTVAYVALETVTGTLDGRAGSFVLVHSASMNAGQQNLSITVAPGSGSGALSGLTGTMGIRIEGGKHYYDFDYTLPEKGP